MPVDQLTNIEMSRLQLTLVDGHRVNSTVWTFFFDLQARATSEIAVASLRDLDNLYTVNCTRN